MIDCQAIVDGLYDGLYTVSRLRRISYWNPAAEAITGYSAADVAGLHCYEGPLRHVDEDGNDLCAEGCPLTWAMAHRCRHAANIFLHHRDGHRVPVRVKVSPLYAADGSVTGAVELFADNTEQMLALERIAELEDTALLDPLTHLANKTYLESQAERYLREMVRQPKNIGMLVVEINDFKRLCGELDNVSLNRLLQVVAETIRSNCRPLDLFGHVDDGCFVGLIHDVTGNQLFTVARKLSILAEKSYFMAGEQIVRATVSVGGTILHADDTFQGAVARCEKQIFAARQQGGQQVSIELRFFPV